MRANLTAWITIACIITVSTTVLAQSPEKFDLVQLYKDNKLTVYNRDVTAETNGPKKSLELSLDIGEGLVWINGVSFSTGNIEVDLKGQDIFQHSFLGIAFHAQDDSTFEAIYFRPFQFHTTDPVRKSHGVQYISLPVYTWQKLRGEYNGMYEKEVNPAPDPDDWFHARIVVTEKEVLVYVNDATTPCLQAPLIGGRKSGKVALYTADQSGGTFANLSLQNN